MAGALRAKKQTRQIINSAELADDPPVQTEPAKAPATAGPAEAERFEDRHARVNIFLPKALHQQLKLASIKEGRSMSTLGAEIIADYIARHHPDLPSI